MKATKIYVGADSTEVEIGGGAGTAINASMYIDNERNMYVKCNKGEIQEGDTVALARWTRSMSGKDDNDKRFTKRGWIAPNAPSIEKYGLAVELTFGFSDETSDYWQVSLTSGLTFEEYEWERTYNGDEEDETGKAYSLSKHMGVAVSRDGVRLTDYLHFKVVHGANELCHLGIW